MTTKPTSIDPADDLRGRLIEFARHRIVLAIHFTSPRGVPCVAVGRPVIVQESHLILSVGPMAETTVLALSRITRVERLGKRTAFSDDRRDVEPTAEEHRANGGLP